MCTVKKGLVKHSGENIALFSSAANLRNRKNFILGPTDEMLLRNIVFV